MNVKNRMQTEGTTKSEDTGRAPVLAEPEPVQRIAPSDTSVPLPPAQPGETTAAFTGQPTIPAPQPGNARIDADATTPERFTPAPPRQEH